jgi:NhaP-type Na+/H+ or K+/H+ antiporter
MIPPFVQQVIGVVLRTAIVWIAAKFGAQMSNDEAVKLAAQIAPIAAVVVWSLYSKYVGRQKLLTALGSNRPMTELDVEARVNDPASPTPSVLTPKTEVPV